MDVIESLCNLSSRNPEKMVTGHSFFATRMLNTIFPTPEDLVESVGLENAIGILNTAEGLSDTLVRYLVSNSFVDIDCTKLDKNLFEGKSDREAAEIIDEFANKVELYLIIG